MKIDNQSFRKSILEVKFVEKLDGTQRRSVTVCDFDLRYRRAAVFQRVRRSFCRPNICTERKKISTDSSFHYGFRNLRRTQTPNPNTNVNNFPEYRNIF